MKMKKTILFILTLLLLTSSVLAIGPGLPHAFRGNVKYSDGTAVQEGVIIAKINAQQVGTSDIIKGVYDLVAESEEQGTVYFYIQGKTEAIAEYTFKEFEITELDLEIPKPSYHSSGSPSSSSSNNNNQDNQDAINLDQQNNLDNQNLPQEIITLSNNQLPQTSSGITGAITGALGTPGAIIISIFIIIIIAGFVFVMIKRKS